MDYMAKKILNIFSEEDLMFVINKYSTWHPCSVKILKRQGIKTCNDVLTRENIDDINESLISGVLRGLDAFGYRRADCSVEKYPTIDDYFRENFHCQWCGRAFDDESNIEDLFCGECAKRYERVCCMKVLEVHLEEVDDSNEDDNEDTNTKEINIRVTIKNNTQIPLNIKLNSFVLYHNKMQFLSDLDYGDYLDEDCLKPGEEIVLMRMWDDKERLYKDDYFIISLSDITNNKEYTYKFAQQYRWNDYWETDLTDRIIRLEQIKKNAISNMSLLGLPKDYIDSFQKRGEVCLIDGSTTIPINKQSMPELYKKIKSLELSTSCMVYAVFNEPHLYWDENTDIFLMLCAYCSDVELSKIYKKGKIFRTIAYAWNKENGNSEHTITCLQQSDTGVWCLPYKISKIIASDFD